MVSSSHMGFEAQTLHRTFVIDVKKLAKPIGDNVEQLNKLARKASENNMLIHL